MLRFVYVARQDPAKAPPRAPIKEFDSVTLLEAVEELGHQVLPGTKGIVVHVYPDGENFEVEFFKPKACVATIHISQIA